MNGLRVIADTSLIFHKDYFTFYNQDCNSSSGTNFGKTRGKRSMKLLSDIVVQIGMLEISNMNF